ncbi:alpha/beta hydrolase [Streptomyces sp. SA15]|uniref:alpha/beta hydrolase family protein n=1 Tax=Streptomyces sp. SA15 TaxID=934019 RepID=UPI000BB000DC|nr:alpha/beta hydrolase [Streptomyces sp. SA15]PAZ12644.1 alpha/beta hydrolase [Streptomyces sp. SA15]
MDPATAAVRTALSAEGEELFDLFRRPHGRSRPRPDERAVIESARTGELRAGGAAAVTYGWGDGERPVLLVHGWESRASRYAKVVARLVERGYSPVSFDAPGHGESEGDSTTLLEYRDIIAELHRKHGEFEAVVGHSFGVLATFLALRQGLRAGRIVAVSPVPDFAYLVDTFCARMRLRPHLGDELRHRIERDLYPGEEDMWTRFSVLHRAGDVPLPLLVVHDEDDEAVDPGQAERIVETFGERARLVTTRRFGHRRILGAPQVVEEITEFVAGGAARAGRPAGVTAR